MELPFTAAEFFGVFARYNTAIWPLHVVGYGLALITVGLAAYPTRWGDRVIAGVLAAYWAIMGGGYHLGFFAEINPAAYVFGAAFLLQSALFLYVGLLRGALRFRLRLDLYTLAGAAIVLYATVTYPLLGLALGHTWPHAPAFGVAPCPGTIFTFGLLLWATSRVPKLLLVIPGLWSLIGFTAALQLGVVEDFGLLVAGVAGVALIIHRERRWRWVQA